MKTLSIALLLAIVSFTAFAQFKPYQPNPVLDKFVGTWFAQTGKKTITITIKKLQAPLPNSKIDYLVGYLLHKDNNQIIEQRDTPVLTLGFNSDMSEIFQDKVVFHYFDIRKQKQGKLTMTLSKKDPDELTAQLAEAEQMKIITDSTKNKKRETGFTLPVSMVYNRIQ